MDVKLNLGQTLTVKVKRLGINGEGIAYYKRLILFIPQALPGEEVRVRVTKATPRYAEAALVKVVKASRDRIVPPCKVYDECGGCQLQHLAYPKQLDFKKDLLQQALAKFKPAGFKEFKLLDTLGMQEPWHYRNKAQFQLRQNPRTKRIETGLYQPNSHHLVAIDDCLVQESPTQETMNAVVQLLNKYQISIHDERKNQGALKTIMVRVGIQTNELQVVFISATKEIKGIQTVVRELTRRCPNVVSIMQNIQAKQTSLVMGEETHLLWGKEHITEKMPPLTFDLSARAFFQLNPTQTNVLYDEARKALDLAQDETLVDAYCGVGTIGLSMAPLAKEVRGMDIIPQSIDNARANAEKIGAKNTRYEVGPAETVLPKWFAEGFKPDAIVVDPPRTGLDQHLLQALVNQPAKKLVYVSCNVSTLARDLTTLTKVYHVSYLQSVDMFPQTARCEVVVKLTKK